MENKVLKERFVDERTGIEYRLVVIQCQKNIVVIVVYVTQNYINYTVIQCGVVIVVKVVYVC